MWLWPHRSPLIISCMGDIVHNNMYYGVLLDHLKDNSAIWQATIVSTEGSSPARSGMKMLIPASGELHGNLGGGELEHQIIAFVRQQAPSQPQTMVFELSSAHQSGSNPTSMICGGSATVFIEALHLPHQLYIIGAGHCGRALGKLAKLCDFHVTLVDNRSESLCSDMAEYCHHSILNDYQDIGQAVCFGPQTFIVIMTHGHVHDSQVLQQCLRREHRYLGMIGSKTKVAETFSTLSEQGYSQQELDRVHAPIGLRIGSQSPHEIAISIMAEIIKELRLS